MIMHDIISAFRCYEHADEGLLAQADRELLDYARQACAQAYAPYSRFLVGCAMRTAGGAIVTGANQENGAFPIGQCAERVTLYTLINRYGREPVDTIAIAVSHPDQVQPAAPCGACRQLIAEYQAGQSDPIRLLLTLAPAGPVIEVPDALQLLPLAFDPKVLGGQR
jgi:cytidine deaminase